MKFCKITLKVLIEEVLTINCTDENHHLRYFNRVKEKSILKLVFTLVARCLLQLNSLTIEYMARNFCLIS